MWKIFEQLLEERNVTAYEVAKACGFSQSILSRWKSGKYIPKTDKMQKIADYFGVPLEYLLTGVQKDVQGEGYYLNPEAAKLAQEMFENPELRVLFDAARDVSPEDLRVVYDMILALKRKEQGGSDEPA